jgi:hypothetical protein
MRERLGRRRAARLLLIPAAAAAVAATAAAAMLTAPIAASASPAPADAVIETTGANVSVHRVPDIYSLPPRSVIPAARTRITVNCWSHGGVANHNILWYHIVSPPAHNGWVAASVTTAATRVPANVTHCPIWEQIYHTRVGSVEVRRGPGTHFAVIPSPHVIPNAGTSVKIICWSNGTPVGGEGWYIIISPLDGYVAGTTLSTPIHRVPGSPDC